MPRKPKLPTGNEQTCPHCHRTLPLSEFHRTTTGGYYKTCKHCRPLPKEPTRFYRAINRPGVTCRDDCASYPCFQGINTIESNLARTCHDFKEKTNKVKQLNTF